MKPSVKRASTALATVSLLCALTVAHAASTGSIKGVVVDEAGNPVKRASVQARDIEPTPGGVVEVHIGAVPRVETDKQGRFVFPGLTPGHRYKMYTMKEEDGYADTTILTYNPTDEAPIVIASAAPRSSPDVRLQLGPKAVTLGFDLKDALTGEPIRDYTITLTRIDTNYWLSGSMADNKVLLPADTDMSIKIEVKGYKPWYFPGQVTIEGATPLRGSTGEVRHISVLLDPESAGP
jgi:hypothetical protein